MATALAARQADRTLASRRAGDHGHCAASAGRVLSRRTGATMSLVGFKASNHPQQLFARGAKLDRDELGTPPELFDALNRRFSFTVDACAQSYNAKCERFWTPEQN